MPTHSGDGAKQNQLVAVAADESSEEEEEKEVNVVQAYAEDLCTQTDILAHRHADRGMSVLLEAAQKQQATVVQFKKFGVQES
ncbi:unnamed protein product [Gadus morhua 'NCC']